MGRLKSNVSNEDRSWQQEDAYLCTADVSVALEVLCATLLKSGVETGGEVGEGGGMPGAVSSGLISTTV